MRIIVTGGAGFLGSHLCTRLINLGAEVICIDNFLTGKEQNIFHLKNDSKFSLINADVTKPLPELSHVDRIYHLASPASPNIKSPKSYHAHPFETMLVNTTGTWNLCELAVKTGAWFLFGSTSEIYGDPLEHPQKETYLGHVSSIGPRSVYDESKRFGETITAAFTRSRGLQSKIARIFNTYGPGMALDDGRVVMEFVQAALSNKPFPVFGNGRQTRSFCYVDDLTDGLIAVMEKGARGQVYNLGNPDECRILDLAERIKQITGSSSEVSFKQSMPEDDPLQRCPDITKAKNDLGWQPKVNLEEGLKRLIDYLKQRNPTTA